MGTAKKESDRKCDHKCTSDASRIMRLIARKSVPSERTPSPLGQLPGGTRAKVSGRGQEVHGKGLRDRSTLRGTGMAFRTARAMVAACALLQLAQPATGFTAVHVGGDVGAGRPTGVVPALTRLRPARGTCASGACSLSAVAVGGGSSQGSGSGRQDGDWDQELAMRIMIERNRAARENADRAYIPMDVAVRWARQMKLWGSREAWEEWIEQNRDSNPFIPPNPEEYYTARGVWLGWRYWLGDFKP